MDPVTIPEIQRTNMASVILLLKSIGINNILQFDYLDPPPVDSLVRALAELYASVLLFIFSYALGALNQAGELTKLGRKMAEFPCDPQMSKAIVKAEKYKCTEEVITIMAMLDVSNSIYYMYILLLWVHSVVPKAARRRLSWLINISAVALRAITLPC